MSDIHAENHQKDPPDPTVFDRVAAIVRDHVDGARLTPVGIKPETRLVEDLGCDSLDVIEIAIAIEDDFGCDLTDGIIDTLATVGDIVAYIERAKATA